MKAVVAIVALFASPLAHAATAGETQRASGASDAPSSETIGTGTDKVICKREKVVGSRLTAKKVCQTAAQWERQRREDQQMAEKVQGARWKS